MRKTEIENLEIKLLLEAILQRYGYDFRQYSSASIKRRIKHFLIGTDFDRISELIPHLIHDRALFESLMLSMTVTTTEMFRDPPVYKALRKKVFPFLKTYPFIKIWHAGCASGEEVYSMAIMLKEEGLYERAQIYATDLNEKALKNAKEGIFPIGSIKKYTRNYQKAGGTKSLSDYYHADSESVIMKRGLRKNILFSPHNLVTDSAFGEMHLIMCRNVFIYFDKPLQERVLELFHDSLVLKGFLCLGTKESMRFSGISHKFKGIADRENIYQAKRE